MGRRGDHGGVGRARTCRSDGGGAPIPSLCGGMSTSAPTHSGCHPRPCESPTFWKEDTFLFRSIKRKLGFTDELFSLSSGLCYLEGWPSTHHTNNNQFSRGASNTCGRDITRVLRERR